MVKKDPVPDIQRLEQLVYSIREGEIRLPKFQRPFVWDKEDMINLWDSIYNGYPIGSVLLWHSSESLKSEREIYGFSVQSALVDVYPTNYLLDGQQRLTTVCGALYWDGLDITSIWAIHFDLDNEKFVYAKYPSQANLFPLNKLLDTSDFIRQCMKFEATPSAKKYYAAAEMLLRSFKDYKVAVVKIGDVGLEEVAPIFERINSTGRKLTIVDLMRAATWKDGFDLTTSIIQVQSKFSECGFPEVSENVILRGVSAAADLGINKSDIDGLRDLSVAKLRSAFFDVQNATILALAFLKQETGFDDFSYLPYGIQLTHLTEIFRLNSQPSDQQLVEIKKWLWTTSVTGYFGGASTGQNSRDLHDVRWFAKGNRTSLIDRNEAVDLSEFLFSEFNMRTAYSTAFCLMLRSLTPRVDNTGREIRLAIGQRKNRNDYQDLFAGTPCKGLNIGQVLKGNTSDFHSVRSEDLKSNLINQEMRRPELMDAKVELMSRAELVAEHITSLIGRKCIFNIPMRLQNIG